MNAFKNISTVVKPVTAAVYGALTIMYGLPLQATAQESGESVASMMKPTNFVEIGVNSVSKRSTKFGEYNGQNKEGETLIGNFNVKGGGAYERGDDATRWEVTGVDVGTTARELGAKVSEQGKWNLGIGYNEVRHYTPGPFVTPFLGNPGSNSFTLPNNFGVVKTTAPGSRALTPVQQSYLRTVDDLYSGRKNVSVNAGYIFDNNWSITADYSRLTQTGAKLMMSGTMYQSAGVVGGTQGSMGAGNTLTNEAVMAVMNPTEYKTQTVKLALNYKGDNGHATASYYGSFFRDQYIGFSWVSPFISAGAATGTAVAAGFGVGNTNQMSTAPDNNFHQLNLSGAYNLRSATKLTATYSRGLNTQNDSYLIDVALLSGGVAPRNSFDGRVITTNASMKVMDTSIKDLTLTGAFKFNERDNRSPSNAYGFYDIGHATLREIANAPYSNKKTQFEIAGDYRLDKAQKLTFSLEREKLSRWCNQFATTTAAGNNPLGTSACVITTGTDDTKLNAGYAIKLDNRLSFKAGFVAAERFANVDHKAYGPTGVTSTGYQNAGDVGGYATWFDTQRKQRGLKLGTQWEANESLTIGAEGQYTHDMYPVSLYGVQDGKTAFANLDATYAISEDSSVSAYSSWHLRTRAMHDLANNVPTSPQAWNQELKDYENVVGFTGKFNRLMKNKLDLVADLSLSTGRVTSFTDILYPATNATCSLPANLTCGWAPDINTRVLRLKLTGDYKLDKQSTIRMGYLYQNVSSNDYMYNIYQWQTTPTTVMPTNQQAPNYSIHSVGASYIYTFK